MIFFLFLPSKVRKKLRELPMDDFGVVSPMTLGAFAHSSDLFSVTKSLGRQKADGEVKLTTEKNLKVNKMEKNLTKESLEEDEESQEDTEATLIKDFLKKHNATSKGRVGESSTTTVSEVSEGSGSSPDLVGSSEETSGEGDKDSGSASGEDEEEETVSGPKEEKKSGGGSVRQSFRGLSASGGEDYHVSDDRTTGEKKDLPEEADEDEEKRLRKKLRRLEGKSVVRRSTKTPGWVKNGDMRKKLMKKLEGKTVATWSTKTPGWDKSEEMRKKPMKKLKGKSVVTWSTKTPGWVKGENIRRKLMKKLEGKSVVTWSTKTPGWGKGEEMRKKPMKRLEGKSVVTWSTTKTPSWGKGEGGWWKLGNKWRRGRKRNEEKWAPQNEPYGPRRRLGNEWAGGGGEWSGSWRSRVRGEERGDKWAGRDWEWDDGGGWVERMQPKGDGGRWRRVEEEGGHYLPRLLELLQRPGGGKIVNWMIRNMPGGRQTILLF